MPASTVVSAALRSWAAATLLRGDSEIVDWKKNIRNWRRYNRVVTVGPADERGCRRVTIEWDEDYEFEYEITIEREPSLGLGWGGGLDLGGRTTHRIGWFEVKGEHHRESGIECPGDTGLASAGMEGPTTVSVGGETIWSGDESPLVSVVTGGAATPILTGCDGHLGAFVDWLHERAKRGKRGPEPPIKI